MRMVLSLVMASMLTVSLSATGKPPLLQVRRAIVKEIYAGDVNSLAAVLAQHRLAVNAVISEDGWPLLYYAVLTGTPDVVEYLLENGAEVNHIDDKGNTPLDAAKFLRSGMPEIVALLEQAGAVHGEDSSFIRIPAEARGAAMGFLKRILSEDDDPSLTLRADIFNLMRAGDINGLAAVLDQNGLTVSSVLSEEGLTLLHYAAPMDATPDVVEYLLENGAEVNPTDNHGTTPLDGAKALNKPEIVALLEQAGAVHGENPYFTRLTREREILQEFRENRRREADIREDHFSTREREILDRPMLRPLPELVDESVLGVPPPSTPMVTLGSTSYTLSRSSPGVSGASDDSGHSREEKLLNVFDENLPLMRAIVLRQLGLPLHDWLAADVKDFIDMVSLKLKRLPGYASKSSVMGDELLDTGLARYLPSVYALSADDVLDSADVLDDFGTSTQTGRHSHEKIFNFKDVVGIINNSLSNTGRREIIDNLNRLDVDEVAELLRKFSLAWSLRIAQAPAKTGKNLLEIKLTQIMHRKQELLERNKKALRTRTSAFAPSVKEIEQLEEELSNLQTLGTMPQSAEKDTMLAEFHANHLTEHNHLLTFTSRDLAWLQRTKIGQMALQDVNLSALAALLQVGGLYRYYFPDDFSNSPEMRNHFLDLLDEHLQQALATN